MGGMKTFSAAIETLHVQARRSQSIVLDRCPSLVEDESVRLGSCARMDCQGPGCCSGCSTEGALLPSHLI